MKIFISHWSGEKALAEAWKQALSAVLGVETEVWYSSDPDEGMQTGDWRAQIEKRLLEADVVLLLITPLSKDKPWLYLEYGFAWGRDKVLDKDTIVAPVAYYLPADKLPSGMRNLQVYQGESTSSARQLITTITKTVCGKEPHAEVLEMALERYKLSVLEHGKTIAENMLFLGKFHRHETGKELEGTWYSKWTRFRDDGSEDVFEFHPVKIWSTEERLRIVGEGKPGTSYYPMEGVISSLGHVALTYWSENPIPYCGTTLLELVRANRVMEGRWEGFTAPSLEDRSPTRIAGRVVIGRDRAVVGEYWDLLPDPWPPDGMDE